MKTFKSILEFQKTFDTNDKCREYLELQIWKGNPICPYCRYDKPYKLSKGHRYNCSNPECKKSFSITVGTVFENTKVPLTKWFLGMYILAVHSKGISSLQLSVWLNVTQKTAWFLNHRIREMLTLRGQLFLRGEVEADETFVGGKEKNKHGHARKVREQRHAKAKAERNGTQYKTRSPFSDKTMVAGMVERGGIVVAKVVPNTQNKTLHKFIKANVVIGATLYTDEWRGYQKLSKFYKHDSVRHSLDEYVRGPVHTNTIEGFWSLLKRQLDGIHHSVSPEHLQRYCNESAFRYNNRQLAQDERFAEAINRCKYRLRYQQLIGKE